jgi:hypothetical protein
MNIFKELRNKVPAMKQRVAEIFGQGRAFTF